MTEHTLFGPSQARAARALMAWSQAELAKEAKVATSTVADFERGYRVPQANSVEAMRAAFEAAGITFYAGGVIDGPVPQAMHEAPPSPGAMVFRYITTTDLGHWADSLEAQATMPELIARLIRADVRQAAKIRFPSDESVQHSGWDGTCVADRSSKYLPPNCSGWEIGTQARGITTKADKDYKTRTTDPGELQSQSATFVFVTPRRWRDKAKWVRERKAEGNWLDVRAYDANDLIHWIEQHPAVGLWLAAEMGRLPKDLRRLEDLWAEWSRATEWPLSADLILADRDKEAATVHRWLRKAAGVLAVQAESPDEAIAFLHASLERLPGEYRLAHEARCLVVTSEAQARQLAESITPLIIVLADPPPGLSGWLNQKGHHVYAAYGSGIGAPEDVCQLTRPLPQSIESTLFDMMAGTDRAGQRPERLDQLKGRARQLAEDSARSLTILRRLMSAGGAPAWAATATAARGILAALLAGAWDESKPHDVRVLERLYRGGHSDLTAELAPLLGAADSPIRKVGTIWKIASPRDAWYLLANQLTPGDLDALEACALEVLQAPDPRFELDSEGRDMAGIRGIGPLYSEALRTGLIQTLLLLSLFGQRIRSTTRGPSRAEAVVRKLLSEADPQRWWSLSSEVRLLAEVAPQTFLDAVEDSLAATGTPVIVLFKEDTEPFSRSYLSNLLWGLEALAWDPQYLGAVANVLAGLAAHDPGHSRIQNRPKNSLRHIFLTLRPQTHATLDERFEVLDTLRQREPGVAWNLMLDIFPRGGVVSHLSPRPQWRDLSAREKEEQTGPLMVRAVEEMMRRLLEDVGESVDRWKTLIELLPAIPVAAAREAVMVHLTRFSGSLTDQCERLTLRATVQRTLSHHRRFPAARWAMPSDELDQLEQVVVTLEPRDSVGRAEWVFNQPSGLGPAAEREANENTIRQAQNAALIELLAERGIDGLFRLAAAAKIPRMIGVAAGNLPADDARDMQIIVRGLHQNAPESEREVALGMIRQYFLARGQQWTQTLVERAVAESWGAEAIAGILGELPPNRTTWQLASSLGAEVERAYWKRIFIYGIQEDSAGVALATEKLMTAGRGREAVELAGNWVQEADRGLQRVRADASGIGPARLSGRNHVLPAELLVRVLKHVASLPWSLPVGRNDMTMFQYYVTEILKFLDETGEVDGETMASLEWSYLRLLEYSDRAPHTLHAELARNPEFFVTVLSALYRPTKETGVEDTETGDSEFAGARAQQAFQLLRTWDQVPGRQADGSINAEELVAWVQDVRRACAKAGRAAVGDIHIGEILTKAPADSSGVWPEAAVRKVIETTRSRDLERGFGIGTRNKRGVTGRGVTEGGTQERSLAQTYRSWSRAIATKSSRTAAVLERIARDYEDEGRLNDEDAERSTWS